MRRKNPLEQVNSGMLNYPTDVAVNSVATINEVVKAYRRLSRVFFCQSELDPLGGNVRNSSYSRFNDGGCDR